MKNAWHGLLVLLPLAGQALAHETRPAYLQFTETQPGRFEVLWKVPQRGDLTLSLAVDWPVTCLDVAPVTRQVLGGAIIERRVLDCGGADGLVGKPVGIDGLAATMTDCLARIEFCDGREQTYLVKPSSPSFEVLGRMAGAQVARQYLQLGVEHIHLGIDHLLFVLGLLLIVRRFDLLVKTVTAFTLAHSVTLGLAALGVVHVPPAPVEAVIALSIVFLGRELLRERQGEQTLTARCPWLVALSFGLLHGFGFAGALSEVGLPQGHIPLALLFFNVGVEIGQLLFIAAVLIPVTAVRRMRIAYPRWLELAPSYAMGSVAMFWVLQRVAAF